MGICGQILIGKLLCIRSASCGASLGMRSGAWTVVPSGAWEVVPAGAWEVVPAGGKEYEPCGGWGKKSHESVNFTAFKKGILAQLYPHLHPLLPQIFL